MPMTGEHEAGKSDDGKGAWFRVDTTGLNAVPTSGRGWAVIGIYLAVLVLWTVIIFLIVGPSPTSIIVYVIVDLVISAALVWLIFQRTEGEWWWQRRRK